MLIYGRQVGVTSRLQRFRLFVQVDGCLPGVFFVNKKSVYLAFDTIIQQSVSCHEACSCNAGKSF